MEPEKVQRALISAFDNAQVTAHFNNEIADMAKTTHDIRKRFEDISRELRDFDNLHYRKQDGSRVDHLYPTWEGYYERYMTLLRDSQKDALDFKFICEDYLEMVIPALEDRGSHPEELKDIANDYKQRTMPHERTSKFYGEAFEALSHNLTQFKQAIQNALVDAEKGIDTQISRGIVQDLKALISKHRDVVHVTPVTDSIVATVNAFAYFWKAINSDTELMISKLDSAIAARTDCGTFLMRKGLSEKGVASLYTALQQAVLHYTFEPNA
ncbi:hypothetical protein BDN72DRAFT_897228 [Pluteus cervinus]|uniref:Uncharacterized protein n=1 Tax=Pluteus cervinus TaxID=181527 RepID=A0ACD3AVI1_9AGAR|nr:hypothetical protein BDN72DRAFT_897228 [Pluteus cervinus]